MALNISIKEEDRTVLGNKRFVSGTMTISVSYTDGGEPIAPKDLGFDTIRHLSVFGDGDNFPVYIGSKLRVYTNDSGMEQGSDAINSGNELIFNFDAFGW